ncbi:fibrosin-1-like protein isoform X4 [Paramormyrops kingsleyae]|uniref:fibrosin-1-like protein isoform X4 n=1 Tax=Paramormyrops kingsleyae TaxID=1676925 RepID=UPI000CD5F4EE|nr:autism susceptibility gene 2 protein-like isoform X4 [Paramormyrops kingsleyae]
MDGKLKTRRSRSQRDRVRRRDARNRSPSSCSDGERSPARDHASSQDRQKPNMTPSARATRPPRRKRRGSCSQEEDIIDGFAITSFVSLDSLELVLQKKTTVSLRATDMKERWDSQTPKRPRTLENGVTAPISENGLHEHGPLEHGAGSERDLDRGRERGKMRTYSKKNKQVKGLLGRLDGNGPSETTGVPWRSDTKDRLSESSGHSLSGRGYSCDSESDVDDKASDVGSEKLFSPTVSRGLTANETRDSKTCSSAQVSGLQRSQEQSSEVPFGPPIASPTLASPPTGSPAPAAAAAPPPATRALSPPPRPIKKEVAASAATPPLVKSQSQPQPGQRVPPPQRHALAVPSHLSHSSLQYDSPHSVSSSGSSAGIGPSRHHASSSHHAVSRASPSAAPTLAISSLPGYSLPSPAHRHPAMFVSPTPLPPPPTLPTNGIAGHHPGAGYPEHNLLRQELNSRFLVQSSDRSGAPPTPSLLRAEFHQHQHTHQHQHQHTHQHTFTPYPGGLPPATIITPPAAPPMVRTRAQNFDKYAPKLDSPFLRHSFFPTCPPGMPGLGPLLPHAGPFSQLQGAFQPKDIGVRPGAAPHTLLQKDPRVSDPFRTLVRKPGKWCALHVQIAWKIHQHQQKMKQMQLEPHKLDLSGKLDLLSRSPGPAAVFPGLPYPHELARPLFSSSGSGHPAASPYGPSPHHSHFLPTSALADPLSRSGTFGGLGTLSANAFGGLGSPSLASAGVFAHKEAHGLPAFGSPHHDPWNRLHRTPSSFPTPPQWPKPEPERSRSEKESEKRESSIAKEERERERDSRHSTRSSPASTPASYQISSLIRSSSASDMGRHQGGGVERHREADREPLERQRDLDVKVKESQERRPSPGTKPVLPETHAPPKDPPSGDVLHYAKHELKIKEERKDEQEVPTGSSDSAPRPLPAHHLPRHSQASPRCSDPSIPSSLHGPHLPHSLPLPLGPMHTMGSLSSLDRARMPHFLGVSPLPASRERLPHPAFAWGSPLREAYHSLDLQRRLELPGQRFQALYDSERPFRDREPHDYSHHEQQLLEVRREQERDRLRLREELDRARLHQLHQSPMEGHLPHMPPFMSALGGLHYPRLSPSAPHSGLLNRTPPTATLGAPPPLVPAGSGRPTSPRRTVPDPRDYSPSRSHKEVEAR